VGRIRCRVAAGDLSGAQDFAEELIVVHPEWASGWLTLAAVDSDKELVYLERALKQRPGDRQIYKFLLEASLTHHDLNRALQASKGLQDAGDTEVATTRALLLDLQRGFVNWNVIEEVLGARGSGLSVARAAVLVAEWPESTWLKLIYARTLWAGGELLSAETLLESLLPEIKGGDAHQSLGMLYMSSERPAAAAEVLLELTEIRPDDLEAQVLLSMALVEAGQLPVARGHLEQLLETHPHDRGLRYTHAYVLMVLQENPSAVEACLLYLGHWPDEGVATWMTGAALRIEARDGAEQMLLDLERMTGNLAYGQLADQL
jgi:tetratricopeptide (TPR) repeat protein